MCSGRSEIAAHRSTMSRPEIDREGENQVQSGILTPLFGAICRCENPVQLPVLDQRMWYPGIGARDTLGNVGDADPLPVFN